MQIGSFKVEQLSEGFFEMFKDGTLHKISPAILDKQQNEADIGNSTLSVGIDPLFISGYEMNIIVDPGLGWGLDFNSCYKDTSNVKTNLEIFDIRPDDIDFVILTHLHFDHAAGCTFVSDEIKTTPVFPNARYLVHKTEWDYAIGQIDQSTGSYGEKYRLDELYKLAAEGRFRFIERENYYPVRGLELIHSGGHTPGHMVLRIHDLGSSAWYTGDLIPSENHLNHTSQPVNDFDPVLAKKMKTRILNRAFSEKAVIFFYHSLYKKAGKLSFNEQEKFVLRDF
jgi:glyoxylase-like metal-dependent hydrolase (beta-lactamase superfamily II)